MKIACLFPGYGSQFVGMAKELYDEHRIIQEYFEEASYCLDTNFVKLCFASSDIELGAMANAYTATFVVSCSLYALLKEKGLVPDLVIGYNQGEYAALFAAKSFAFPDGLYLLSKYAAFYTAAIEKADFSATSIVGLSTKKLERICKKAAQAAGPVSVALYHTGESHIVTGMSAAVDLVRKEVLTQPDVTVDDQSIEIGMHSTLMDSVVDQLRMYREKVDFKDTTISFLAGTDATFVEQGARIKDYILEAITSPVRWDMVIDRLHDVDLIIEIGPGTTLAPLIAQKYPDKKCISVNKKSDVEEVIALLAPIDKELRIMAAFSYEDTYSKVLQLIADKLARDTSATTPETTLAQDLGLDSLDMVELIMDIEDHFNCLVDDAKVEQLHRVGDLVDYVQGLRKK